MFDLNVKFDDLDSVQITIPPPVDPSSINNRVPNVFHLDTGGTFKPVNYKLRENVGAGSPL